MSSVDSKAKVAIVSVIGILYAFSQFITALLLVFLIGAGSTAAVVLPNIAESEEEKVLSTFPEYDDGFQLLFGAMDVTVYGEYYYSNLSDEILEENELFQPVSIETEEEILIKKLIRYYEEKVSYTRDDSMLGDDLNKVYRFDKVTMDDGDWYYLKTERAADCAVLNDETFELMCQDFDLYYYDHETETIYLMHDDV